MTCVIVADHPDGWLLECTADEPPEVREMAELLTKQVRSGVRWPPSSVSLRAAVKQARSRALRADDISTPEQRKCAFAMARELMLDREDRLALAEVLTEREVESWNDLTWAEMSRVIDAMSGYVAVRHLRLEKNPG